MLKTRCWKLRFQKISYQIVCIFRGVNRLGDRTGDLAEYGKFKLLLATTSIRVTVRSSVFDGSRGNIRCFNLRLCRTASVHKILLGGRVYSIPSFLYTGSNRECVSARRVPPGIQLIAKRRLGLLDRRGAERDAKHAGVSSMTRVRCRVRARDNVCVVCVSVARVHRATQCAMVPPTKRKATGQSRDSPLVQATGQWPRSCTRTRCTRCTALHPEPYGECTPWTGINGLAGTFNCCEWESPSPLPRYSGNSYPNHRQDVPTSRFI